MKNDQTDQNIHIYIINYIHQVNVISDVACQGEDRLLQCEMQNAEVDSNIQQYRKIIFEDAFLKTSEKANVSFNLIFCGINVR